MLKTTQNSQSKKIKKLNIIFFVSLILIVILLAKTFLTDFHTLAFQMKDLHISYIFIFSLFLNVLFQLFFIPGVSAYTVTIGFMIKDFKLAMFIVYIPAIIVSSLSYFVARFILKNIFHKTMTQHKIYKIFQNQTKKEFWKISFMIRILTVPASIKTYVLTTFDMNFITYAIPAFLYYLFYLSFYILIGITIKDAKESLFEDKSKWTKTQKTCFYSLIIFVGIGQISILHYLGKKIMRQKLNQKI